MQRLSQWILLLLAVLLWNGSHTPLRAADTFFSGNMEEDAVYDDGNLRGDLAHGGNNSEWFTGSNAIHEYIYGDFGDGELPQLDSGETFSLFTYEVWVFDDNDATQTYKLGVRFARHTDSGWQESDYSETDDRPVDAGWQKLSFDITALVNQAVRDGYTSISRFSIRGE